MIDEKPTMIQVTKKTLDYAGKDKFYDAKVKINIDNMCWNKLWNKTYSVLKTKKKFDRVKYCIDQFPIYLEQKKKLLGFDFTMNGPANELEI